MSKRNRTSNVNDVTADELPTEVINDMTTDDTVSELPGTDDTGEGVGEPAGAATAQDDALKHRGRVRSEFLPIEGARNSDRVRAKIAEAKAEGKTFEQAKAAIVSWATAELGMQKALAGQYVKNNWSRVAG